MGKTMAERITNRGIRDFTKYLAQSPNRVEGITCRELEFDGVILTNKQDLTKTTKLLLVPLEVEVQNGDIVFFKDTYWILYQRNNKNLDTHKSFYIVQCNYLLKWVDTEGQENQTYVYLVSSKDSVIKENFRTWNSLITPQPNKYIEILAPDVNLEKGTRFLVEEEGWSVVEFDRISVSGVRYVSSVEDKVNFVDDDIPNNVANSTDISAFSVEIPEEPIHFSLDGEIFPIYAMYKNGRPYEGDVDFSASGVLKYEDGVFSAEENGLGTIIIKILERGLVVAQAAQPVVIEAEPQANPLLLKGSYKILLDRTETYTLLGFAAIIEPANITISDGKISLLSIATNSFVLKANSSNQVGKTTLSVLINGKTYIKEVEVLPLWGRKIT